MNFELVRAGWPNTAAIVALAIMPIVALCAAPQMDAAVARAETLAFCPADDATVLATLLPETITE